MSWLRNTQYIEQAIRVAGAGKVLFGTDGVHPLPEIEKIKVLKLSPEEENKIFSKHSILHTCRIGKAKIVNVKIRDIFDITKRYLKEDINFLLRPESK